MVENTVICRILNIQRRKKYSFLYVYGAKYRQMLIDNEMLDSVNLKKYDIICAKVKEISNQYNSNILNVLSIERVGERAMVHSSALEYSLTNECNKIRSCKKIIIDDIEMYLKNNGYKKSYNSIITNNRGSSMASPLKVNGKYLDAYLRLTHEINLKKEVCFTLQPIYEIGYVARDVYSHGYKTPVYLSLETVAPFFDISHIVDILQFIIKTATQRAEELSVEHTDVSNVKIMEYKEYSGKEENIILTECPVSSPLVKTINGKCTEIKWIYKGLNMGHGYVDENNYDKILKSCKRQLEILESKNVNGSLPKEFLEVLKIGMPDTVSLGVGLDRFFCVFFKYKTMREYFNGL